jgi:hypothetical protein
MVNRLSPPLSICGRVSSSGQCAGTENVALLKRVDKAGHSVELHSKLIRDFHLKLSRRRRPLGINY